MLRTAWRQICRQPRIASLIVLTIAAAIAVNTAMFSLADELLFRDPPFPDPHRIIHLEVDRPALILLTPTHFGPQVLRMEELVRDAGLLAQPTRAVIRRPYDANAEAVVDWGVRSAVVSPEFLDLFGVRPSHSVAGIQQTPSAATDLEGLWEAEMMENDGQVNLPPRGRMRLTFRGTSVTLRGFLGNQNVEGTFTIEPAERPKKLDITVPGKSSTSHIRAIYSVEGDKLMFAFPRRKAQRQTSLDRPVNADTVLVTFRKLPSKS